MPDLILNEEEQMLQTTLREFVDREIAPKAKESDERAEFQWDAWRGFAELGLTGLGVDVKYGGSGPAGLPAGVHRRRGSGAGRRLGLR